MGQLDVRLRLPRRFVAVRVVHSAAHHALLADFLLRVQTRADRTAADTEGGAQPAASFFFFLYSVIFIVVLPRWWWWWCRPWCFDDQLPPQLRHLGLPGDGQENYISVVYWVDNDGIIGNGNSNDSGEPDVDPGRGCVMFCLFMLKTAITIYFPKGQKEVSLRLLWCPSTSTTSSNKCG